MSRSFEYEIQIRQEPILAEYIRGAWKPPPGERILIKRDIDKYLDSMTEEELAEREKQYQQWISNYGH